MSELTFYGEPPMHENCNAVSPPDGLSTKADQRLLLPVVATGMIPHALSRKASYAAVERQLRLQFRDTLPIIVTVPSHGTFRVGEKGWCVE